MNQAPSDDFVLKENRELKNRLAKEFGMMGYMSFLTPLAENAFLKSILEVEMKSRSGGEDQHLN